MIALLFAAPSYCQTSIESPLDPQILGSYAGRYQASADTVITVRCERDHLALEVNLGSPMQFFPESTDLFFHKQSPTKITFVRDDQGNVTHLVLHRSGEHRARRISDTLPSEIVRTVSVGGADYRALISGTGKASVVLVEGLENWAKVRLGIEAVARVISYKAVKGGAGAEGHVPSNAREQCRVLRALLQALDTAPPYILVGQSFNGALIRIYADLYPEDIAGLVLIDPFHEHIIDWLKVNQPENHELFIRNAMDNYFSEWDGFLHQLSSAQLPKGIPVVLLTAGQRQIRKTSALEQKLKPEDFAAAAQAIIKVHQEWISRVSGGKHIVVPGAGHEIQTDQPGFVVEAIKEVLNGIKEANREQ